MEGNQESWTKETILVVDDAEPIRRMVCAMLRQAGYRCLDASNGQEGLEIFFADPGAIDLILTDVMMPRMGGPEFARLAAGARPEVRVMFMSGFSDDPIVHGIERMPGLFMPKPFTAGTLMEKVRQALDGPWRGLPGSSFGVNAR